MYNLPYFKEPDQSEVEKFIRDNPFALVCGASTSGEPVATQLPLLISRQNDRFIFRGHLMRNTDHHKAFTSNPSVLCVFAGAHSYVSASWYTDPLQGSTWNYITVQAKGAMRFLGFDALQEVLSETTAHFENNPSSPSLFEKLPAEYVSGLSKAILAFEIEVKSIEHVFKLSQNRDEESYLNIIQQLQKGDANAKSIANEMQKRYIKLFKKEDRSEHIYQP